MIKPRLMKFNEFLEDKDANIDIIESKKKFNSIIKKSKDNAKLNKCYYCGKETTSFCNSHTIPHFCLKNITADGMLCTTNAIIKNPLYNELKGLNNSGTFHIICRDCDKKTFADYENPENYIHPPTQKMLAEISLKNNLQWISKRLNETEFYKLPELNKSDNNLCEYRNEINALDLKEFKDSYNKAKKIIEKNSNTGYYLCFYKKLPYVVPIAFQSTIAVVIDFEGNIINDIYNFSPDYEIRNINLCVFPLESESVIFMFIEDGDKRYRKFYKQFNKLSNEDQLLSIVYMMFAYSEEIYFSKTILNEIQNNTKLCNIGKTSLDMISETPFFNSLEVLKSELSFENRKGIPNLLSEKYKIK